jgi:hypothetical protein
MVEVIDEDGRLFGVVNVVDLVVVLVVLALVGAGVALVMSDGDAVFDDGTNRPVVAVVEVQAENVSPTVAAAIPEGEVDNDQVTGVRSKTVEPQLVALEQPDGNFSVRDHPRQKQVTLKLALNAARANGRLAYGSGRLRIGQRYDFTIGNVSVQATVTDIRDVESRS